MGKEKEMTTSPYKLTREPNGIYRLTIGQILIGQATSPEELKAIARALNHRDHAKRVLRNTCYDAQTNEIKDGEAR